MTPLIHIDWDRGGGAAVFYGTSVRLDEVLRAAHLVSSFEELQQRFPFVTKESLAAAIPLARECPDIVARPLPPAS